MDHSITSSTGGYDLATTVDALASFTGGAEEFLSRLLETQCDLAAAEAGALLRGDGPDTIETLALWPSPAAPEAGKRLPAWIDRHRAEILAVARSGNPAIRGVRGQSDLYGQTPQRHLIILPASLSAEANGAAAYLIKTRDAELLRSLRDWLMLSLSLLRLFEARRALEHRAQALLRLQQAGRVLAAINEHDRAKAASMAFCNELASVFQADRVSVGFLRGRYVKALALSHTEHFSRKMVIVQAIEAAMEESLDQDIEVLHPAPESSGAVSRAAAELSNRYGPEALVSVPLRRGGEPEGVVTLERASDRPFSQEDVELLRLTAELCTARLAELQQRDRWVGARLAAEARRGAASALGAQHTWVKVAAIAALCVALFLIFAKGPDHIDSPFVVEASQRRVVPAPFEGYLEAVHVEPNDRVTGGETLLAELDETELRLRLAPLEYQRLEQIKAAAKARRDGNQVEAQIAQARADQLQARIDLLRHRLSQTEIRSPIDGVVLRGELQQKIGAPVQQGDVLFEIAPIDDLRAVLMVPEHRRSDLREGQRGELASAANPGRYLPFVVERINPMAEVRDERNVFRVRVRLTGDTAGLLPGVEGAAKVRVGEDRYAWLWTRDLVRWVRMKLWI